MDLPVVEASLNRCLDQPVLLDSGETVELRGGNSGSEMIAAPGFVAHEYVCPRKRCLDHRLYFCQVGQGAEILG
ncbi:MAG: hypothetical protein QOF13_2 [Solirubrobacterales bacterium]|nr:hypothetical protein [Solirubrobacterales bacterium]